jgi:uncharacterized protein (DUF58 family)
MRLTLENPGRLGISGLVCQDSIGPALSQNGGRFSLALGPGETRYLEYDVSFADRGLYHLGPLTLECADPLGFWKRRRTVEDTAKVIVYPNPLSVEFLRRDGLPLGSLKGMDPSLEDPLAFRSAREYRSGDDPRRVNWKASARSDRLMVNECLPTTDSPLVVILDLHFASYPRAKRWAKQECAVSAAAWLCLNAERAHSALALATNGLVGGSAPAFMPPCRDGLFSALETLALVKPLEEGEGHAFRLPARLPARARVAFVGCLVSDETLGALAECRSRGHRVELFLADGRETQRLAALFGERAVYEVRGFDA